MVDFYTLTKVRSPVELAQQADINTIKHKADYDLEEAQGDEEISSFNTLLNANLAEYEFVDEPVVVDFELAEELVTNTKETQDIEIASEVEGFSDQEELKKDKLGIIPIAIQPSVSTDDGDKKIFLPTNNKTMAIIDNVENKQQTNDLNNELSLDELCPQNNLLEDLGKMHNIDLNIAYTENHDNMQVELVEESQLTNVNQVTNSLLVPQQQIISETNDLVIDNTDNIDIDEDLNYVKDKVIVNNVSNNKSVVTSSGALLEDEAVDSLNSQITQSQNNDLYQDSDSDDKNIKLSKSKQQNFSSDFVDAKQALVNVVADVHSNHQENLAWNKPIEFQSLSRDVESAQQNNLVAGFAGELQTQEKELSLSERIHLMSKAGVHSASIRVLPEEMGPIDIMLKLEGDRAHISFASQNILTREALQDLAPNVQQAMEQQGYQQVNIDVCDFSQFSQSQQQNKQNYTGRKSLLIKAMQNEPSNVKLDIPVVNKKRGIIDMHA